MIVWAIVLRTRSTSPGDDSAIERGCGWRSPGSARHLDLLERPSFLARAGPQAAPSRFLAGRPGRVNCKSEGRQAHRDSDSGDRVRIRSRLRPAYSDA